MGCVSRDKFLSDYQPRKTRVDLGDGEYIWVQDMNALRRVQFEALAFNPDGTPKAAQGRELLAWACCVDDDGKPLFEESDIPLLAEMIGWSTLDKIGKAASEFHNGADIEKKSEPPTPSSSPTGSPAT